MIIRISSVAFSGVEVINVDVQVQITSGIPSFTIVGLADKTIGESKERVRAAIFSMGLALPAKKILVNLAPADLIKEGSHFDLAIAVAILAQMGVLPIEEVQEYIILGELSLDGSILPVSGVLPSSINALSQNLGIICPKQNGSESAWSGNEKILAPSNLLELINHFKGNSVLTQPKIETDTTEIKYPDLKDIKGQAFAKRALEIAAAGGHNLLMYGPPGTGKSMLAQRLPGIIPSMSVNEILECSTIASVAGKITDGKLIKNRPFRAPHHSCSIPAMVGGGMGRKVKPGEISLAHNGVLFLDELPEFPSSVIDALRQPMETGEVLISRSSSHVKYPANFQLIAAMNPCKCGYLNDEMKACNKAPKCGLDYQMKISGPMMDRFDMHVEVGQVDCGVYYDQNQVAMSESSADIAKRVENARNIQIERYSGYGIKTNNRLDGQLLIDYAIPTDGSIEMLNQAANKFRLSVRAYNRILRVARTIADLEGVFKVKQIHLAESLQYRKFERLI
jgi:magnesium chelatase family protein